MRKRIALIVFGITWLGWPGSAQASQEWIRSILGSADRTKAVAALDEEAKAVDPKPATAQTTGENKSVYEGIVGNEAPEAALEQSPRAHGKAEIVPADADAEDEGSDEDPGEFTRMAGFNVDYFGLFYGPSVGNGSRFLPTPDGAPNPSRPVQLSNFMTLSHGVADHVNASMTGFWAYQPAAGGMFALRDPFARISHNALYSTDTFDWYGDLRLHMPVSDPSRAADMLVGLQTFHVLSYIPEGSRYTFGTFVSARYNIYGSHGNGDDVQFYVAPNVAYRISPTLAATCLLELFSSHPLGDNAGSLLNDGNDIEPGVSWDVTKTLNVNPYLNVPTNGNLSIDSISLGMMLSWRLM